MQRKLSGALAALAFVAAIGGGAIIFTPEPAQAQLFAAGNAQDGICTCPTDWGNCVCKITE